MKLQHLMRVVYKTDVDPDEPEYQGSFSDPFPAEAPDRKIVGIDWQTIPGAVEVTWLLNGGRGASAQADRAEHEDTP